MKILYIYRDPQLGFSIHRVFRPIESFIKEESEVKSINMAGCGYSIRALVSNIFKARKAVKSADYDIIHITGQEHYLIPFLPRKKVVVTVHDLGFVQNERGLRGLIKHLLFVKSLSLSRALTCISEKSKSEVLRFCNVKDNQVEVINNCVDPAIVFHAKKIDKVKPRILHIGTMENKNLVRVAEALQSIPSHLRIIGIITEEQKNALEENEIDYSVVSGISDEQLHKELYDCDVVSFPSLYEGFGMPIVEAQAAGRVVVTSNLSPMKEVSGGAAVLVNPCSVASIRDGFVEAINNSDKLITDGLMNKKRFEVSAIAQQYFDLYRHIVAL